MTPEHPAEPWEAWTARMAGDLAALTADQWVTYAVRPDAAAASPAPGRSETRGWRRRRSARAGSARSGGGGGGQAVPDVLVQARLLEGVLALELIGDTEFEGLSDLSAEQQAALVALGWAQEGADPEFSRTFAPDEHRAAAELLQRSLHEVLGAPSPEAVDVRHG